MKVKFLLLQDSMPCKTPASTSEVICPTRSPLRTTKLSTLSSSQSKLVKRNAFYISRLWEILMSNTKCNLLVRDTLRLLPSRDYLMMSLNLATALSIRLNKLLSSLPIMERSLSDSLGMLVLMASSSIPLRVTLRLILAKRSRCNSNLTKRPNTIKSS